MSHISIKIKSGSFSLVWIDLPSNGRTIPPGKRPAIIRQVAAWIRQATGNNVTCILISLRGKHWQDESLQLLLTDSIVHEASFHLCAMGIKVSNDSTKPSAVQLHAYATFPLEPIRCKHSKSIEHTFELKDLQATEGRASIWLKAKETAYKQLISHWRSVLVPLLGSKPDRDCNINLICHDHDTKRNGTSTSVTAYPTDEKERAKAKKKAGYIAKKKVKLVEDHYDDIGEDLSGLGPDVKLYLLDICAETVSYVDDYNTENLVHNLIYWFPMGSPAAIPKDGIFAQSSLESSFQALLQSGSGLDICELCGGAARPSQIAIRRRLQTGENFDLVTGYDLGNGVHQSIILNYINTNNVLVVIMAPSCRTLGPTSNLNQAINYDTWLQHYNEDKPHIHFCGKVALLQIKRDRYFFGENPWPTYLLKEGDWAILAQHKSVSICIIHQCRLGLKGANGLPIKKPTVLISNSPQILLEFRNLQCPGNHQHDTTWGSGELLHSLQVWPWQLAERLINGIISLIQHLRHLNAYPEIGTGPQDPDVTDDQAAPWMKCPGCKGRMARSRREHNRTPGICKYPNDEPEPEWQCPGCARNPPRARGHEDHTEEPGSCRWASTGTRTVSGRARGSHPREAKPQAAADPASDIPGPQLNPGSNTSTSHDEPLPDLDPPISGGPSSSSNSRGPDLQPRQLQPQIVHRATGTSISDWTSFDISKSLRILRTGTPVQQKNELRKLHLRWWHATRGAMEKILGAAGLPQLVLSMIQQIVATCRECRAWQSPAPSITPSVDLVTDINHSVEADIMFYKAFMAWHMVDRSDRWHAAVQILSKNTESICEAISTCWISIHGPFKFLIVDGERGLTSQDAQDFLNAHGIQIKTRAPQQHAQIVERRGAILRHAMHLIEEQLEKEGIQVTFKQLLAEAVFAGNSLITFNGASPYNSRFGRQPRMLPDIEAPPDTTLPGPARYTHRIREVSLQKIIESSALARINRALRTVTTTPGEVHNYQPGDFIDFHRPPANKDSSGWHGPARVAENCPRKGQVKATHNKHDIIVRYPDARRSLDFPHLVFGTTENSYTAAGQAATTMTRILRTLPPHVITTIGYLRLKPNDGWVKTRATTTQRQLALAIQHVVFNVLCYPTTFAVRAGRGIAKFPPCSEADFSVVVYWNKSFDHVQTYEADTNQQVPTKTLVGECWTEYLYLQLLCLRDPEPEVCLRDILEPEAEHESPSDRASASDNPPGDPERLSTIHEADERDSDDNDADADLFNEAYFDVELESHDTIASVADRSSDERVTTDEALHYFTAGASLDDLNKPNEHDDSGNAFVEILFPQDTAKLILNEPPTDGQCARLRVYTAGIKTAIISTDTDMLTAAEYQKYAKEVAASIKEELMIWIAHHCFSRRPRKGARNILDVRWVGKWKKIKSKLNPSELVRIIRMRLTLRGFKDVDANDILTFAGTSSRLSQKLLVSEAVNRQWKIVALDVSKAFLKGVSYKELAQSTGEPERDVNFELDADAVAILQTLPGFTDFDPRTEVLHCDKPGTGCKDAPRAWGIQLTKATNDDFGFRPTTYDDQLVVRHATGKLDCIGTKHVDDIKAAGPLEVLMHLINVLEKHFGKGQIDITWHKFKACGIQHTPITDGYELDQIEYVGALKAITHPDMLATKNAETTTPTLASLFLSLLMALAFALQTRSDLCVYVVNLQRYAQKPLGIHVRRLNALVRYAQANPRKLTYRRIEGEKALDIHSDAGFKKEIDDDGHCDGKAMRGANFILRSKQLSECNRIHLLDCTVGMLKQVTRSTFTSETGAVLLAADQGLVLRVTLAEIELGPIKIEMKDGLALAQSTTGLYPIDLVTDSLNLLLAIDTPHIKPPAEKSFMLNLLWLKQQLESGALRALVWSDTRDMSADGHTKGSISRDALIALLEGYLYINYSRKELTWAAQVDTQGKRLREQCVQRRCKTSGERATKGQGKATSADITGDGPSEYINPFATLGFNICREDAELLGQCDINSAYRKLALLNHPDKCSSADAASVFRDLKYAKEILTMAWANAVYKKDIIDAHLLPRREFKGAFDREASRKRQETLDKLQPDKDRTEQTETVAPGIFLIQRELKQALFFRKMNEQARSETRLVAYTAHEAIAASHCRPARLSRTDKVSKEASAEARQRLKQAVDDTRIQKRKRRMLDKRKSERLLCEREQRPYKGNTLWRINHMAQHWARAARRREAIETDLQRRLLTPAASQEKQRRPDERVADARAWTKYNREQHEWKPPKPKAPITKRRYNNKAATIERNRKIRELRRVFAKRLVQGRLALEDTKETPPTARIAPRRRRPHTSDEIERVPVTNDDYTRQHRARHNKRRRKGNNSERPVLAAPVPVGRVNTNAANASTTTFC